MITRSPMPTSQPIVTEAPTMRAVAWVFVMGVIGVASLLSLAIAWSLPQSVLDLWIFLGFCLMAALMRIFVIDAPHHRSYEGSTIIFVGSIWLLPPDLFILLVLIAHGIEWAKERWLGGALLRAWYIQPFNMAKTILSGLSAYAVLSQTEFSLVDPLTGTMLFVILLAIGVYVAINQLLLGVALSLARGIPFHQAGLVRDALLTEIPLACMGYIVVELFQRHPLLPLFVLAPILLIYQAFLLPKLQDEHLQVLEQTNQEIHALNEDLFRTLAKIFDAHDPYVGGHAAQVAAYAVAIARQLGLPPERVEIIRRSGYLHDIGKIAIPDAILHKPEKLTDDEYAYIKRHAEIGADLVATSQGLQYLAPFIRHHHERWDGRGYPAGLAGTAIPLEARILNICDSVEAMASDRPYHRAMSVDAIMAEVIRCAGTQFDPTIVKAFLRVTERMGSNFVVNSARTVAGQHIHDVPVRHNLVTTMLASAYGMRHHAVEMTNG